MVNSNRRKQSGFSLVELLITLALMTILSVMALNVLTPWLAFKQTLDTDRKLQDMRQALQGAYTANAMTADLPVSAGRTFLGLSHDTAATGAACSLQDAALESVTLSAYLSESGQGAARDGFSSPLCFFISPQVFRSVEGVRIYYHMIAIVSTGQEGTLSAGTSFDPATGQLLLGGGNKGVVVNGYGIQYAKYRDTLDRINRVASLYESYFTTRFLNTADRDVSRDYFYNASNGAVLSGDPGGSIAPTTGWTSTFTHFSATLGISPVDATSAFESNNTIEVGNNAEAVTTTGKSTTVRSPSTLSTGATPPYTALLRAKLPGPDDNYIVRAVVGNY